jgi:hypothetical protein
MERIKITLKNDVHNTSANVWVKVEGAQATLSVSQTLNVNKKLCGIRYCTCTKVCGDQNGLVIGRGYQGKSPFYVITNLTPEIINNIRLDHNLPVSAVDLMRRLEKTLNHVLALIEEEPNGTGEKE